MRLSRSARQAAEVHTLAELRRQNQLEHPLVAGLLPFSKCPHQVNIRFVGAETMGLAFGVGDRAFAYEVAAMCRPLAGRLVAAIGDPYGAALGESSRSQ
jgi:hypothetical protein